MIVDLLALLRGPWGRDVLELAALGPWRGGRARGQRKHDRCEKDQTSHEDALSFILAAGVRPTLPLDLAAAPEPQSASLEGRIYAASRTVPAPGEIRPIPAFSPISSRGTWWSYGKVPGRDRAGSVTSSNPQGRRVDFGGCGPLQQPKSHSPGSPPRVIRRRYLCWSTERPHPGLEVLLPPADLLTECYVEPSSRVAPHPDAGLLAWARYRTARGHDAFL